MAISTQKDAKTRKTYLLAEGVVGGVYVNELRNIKTYAGKDGKSWTPTHNINIVVDGDRISLGLTDKTDVRVKDVDDQYQDLVKGAEVSVVVEEGVEYKGQMQYQARKSDVTIITMPEVSQKPSGGSTGGFQGKRDDSGIIAGNGFNAARAFYGSSSAVELDEFIGAAKDLIDIGNALRKHVTSTQPDLDNYTVGARSGMALLAAAESADSINDVFEIAVGILDKVVPELVEYAKETSSEKKEEPKKSSPKKTAVKKQEPVQEERENPAPEDFEDEDVPFN